jgi:hypothetical protein
MSQINKINVAKLLVFFYLSFNPKNFVALRQTSIMGLVLEASASAEIWMKMSPAWKRF